MGAITVKVFEVNDAYEAEVWLEIQDGRQVSLHTLPAAQREATAQNRAIAWINSDACRQAVNLELGLAGGAHA